MTAPAAPVLFCQVGAARCTVPSGSDRSYVRLCGLAACRGATDRSGLPARLAPRTGLARLGAA